MRVCRPHIPTLDDSVSTGVVNIVNNETFRRVIRYTLHDERSLIYDVRATNV